MMLLTLKILKKKKFKNNLKTATYVGSFIKEKVLEHF